MHNYLTQNQCESLLVYVDFKKLKGIGKGELWYLVTHNMELPLHEFIKSDMLIGFDSFSDMLSDAIWDIDIFDHLHRVIIWSKGVRNRLIKYAGDSCDGEFTNNQLLAHATNKMACDNMEYLYEIYLANR